MSCYFIQYVQGAKMMRPVQSKEEYLKLRDSDRQKWLVSEIRKGKKDGSKSKEEIDKMKRQLIQFNYSCIPGEDGHLKGVKTPSMSFGMDIDFDPEDPDYEKKMAEVPRVVMEKKDELGLLMMERSVGKGYHLVCKRTIFDGIAEGKILENQEMNLRRTSEIIGCAADKNARDVTRVFFGTTASEEDLLFLDEGLFEAAKAEGQAAKLPGTVAAPQGAAVVAASAQGAAAAVAYQGIPYSAIIKKYWDMFYDGKEPCMGDRNVRTFELVMLLRSICDYSQEMLQAVIPRYDGFPEDEWRRTIESALKEPRKGMPYRLRQVLDSLKQEKRLQLMANGKTTGYTANNVSGQLNVMPERPRRMPKFLNLVSSKVDPYYKPMVEESIWPGVCAHLHGVKFWYIDGTDCEANISSPLIGKQSAGKSMVNKPIEYVLADITERDNENEQRETQWRERNQGKGSSKDRQQRPKDIVIQRLDKDLTPAALSQSLIDGERNGQRRIITKVDEIEMLAAIGNGRIDTVSLLVRYGFDSARWGQRRVGLDSVNGSYTVRWVWNASCTAIKAKSFINKNWVANGSLSRLNVNTIIKPEGDNDIPKVGAYDDKYAEDLKVYIDHLNAASGDIRCKQADALAYKMLKEHNEIADLCESEGYRVFSYRAVKIGWLKACILYIMNDYKWDKTIAEYVAYSVRRDLWAKFLYFGNEIEAEFNEEKTSNNSGPKNMLTMLAHEFTYEEYMNVRQSVGKDGDGKATLRTWQHRGYVVYDDMAKRYIKKKG
ncbi:MAG: hypothetical protein Q4D64_08665 [Prevotellaceae bacterium]|nr:hypothetical protein [Prevotellaceae bacterium]